ncbi:MAG: PilN domain-containing protein [Candidatus Eisenbacteria bacterium]|nr:PilN domain-containing protein [Candidatus Eisenbacteria bacterium]
MIRINLLPGEEKGQRKAAVTFKAGDLVVPLAVLLAAGVVIAGTVLSQKTRAAALAKSIAEVESQSRVLAPQIERVNRLAQERAELDLRLGIIGRLQRGRTQSVRLMDELAKCVPDHLWLVDAQQDGASGLNLEGVTFSNLVVSDLMSRLERSPMFANVELQVAEHAAINEHDIVRFRVSCLVTPNRPAE